MGQTIFDGVSWFAPEGARVGLVGANGSGKSTLLRVIAGQIEPDDGVISLPKECTVGYLPQEVLGVSGGTVLEYALNAFADVRTVEAQCRRVEEQLATMPADDPRHDEVMEAYARLRSDWDACGTYDMEAQAERVLVGLGADSQH